jgi:hypothetical protein
MRRSFLFQEYSRYLPPFCLRTLPIIFPFNRRIIGKIMLVICNSYPDYMQTAPIKTEKAASTSETAFYNEKL